MTNLWNASIQFGSFIPHGHCYLWQTNLVSLHVLSDGLIALSYYSIPLALLYLVRKRKDLPFEWIFLLFGAFIVACGTTHLLDIWTLWYPTYWLSGLVKAFTAIISVATATQLIPLVPQVLALPSPAQLERTNSALQSQIAERLRVEAELKVYQTELERLADERTDELRQVNATLKREISDRKQVEQRLRESEEQLQLGVQVAGVALAKIDYVSNTVELSPEAASLYGIAAHQVTITRDLFYGTVHPEEFDMLTQHLEQVIDPAGSGWFNLNHRVVYQDGTVRWLSVRKQVFFDRCGDPPRPDYAIIAAIDITDRMHIERDRERILQQQQAALAESERVNRIKDEFLAVLSHELRSPLNPILGWTQLLQSRRLDETKTREALATIERNAKAQVQLIDDLLDMARVLRGKLTLNVAPINLLQTVKAAIETVQPAAIAKSIRIQPMLSNIGHVSGDAVRVQQIVWNLLANAVKFTPPGGQVDIRLESVDNQAQITVTDTGRGISSSFLPHIFESFRQEDASVTRKHGGLGLGLTIVYQLVEAHGGTITVESLGEDQGATFTVKLPLLNGNSDRTISPLLPAQTVDLSGIRVLAIDDEPDCRELLSFIISQAGGEVMTVASAAEFLMALESFHPHIVVSDIGMPEIDGYTLLKQIRALSPEQGGQVPAIALTAYAGTADQQQALAAGFQLHVSKPVEADQLLAAIAIFTTYDRP